MLCVYITSETCCGKTVRLKRVHLIIGRYDTVGFLMTSRESSGVDDGGWNPPIHPHTETHARRAALGMWYVSLGLIEDDGSNEHTRART